MAKHDPLDTVLKLAKDAEEQAGLQLKSAQLMLQKCQSQLEALRNETHEYKTVAIDTITQLNTIMESEVLARDPKAKSINQALGGYGAGFGAVANAHKQLRDICELLKEEKGMNIVFIAHTDIDTITPPDSDAYNKYTLRMNKRCVSHYSDNVDMVAHVQLQNFVRTPDGGGNGQAVSTGARIIKCHASAESICKNRYGISQEIPFNEGENPLTEIIKGTK